MAGMRGFFRVIAVSFFMLLAGTAQAAPDHHPVIAPVIAIVIDDMGLNRKESAAAITLPSAVTLSYLPYARQVQQQVDEALARGHEIFLHLPMEADSPAEDPGPNAIVTGLTEPELQKRLANNLDAFEGYSGVNNHMGSSFTQNRAGLEIVMKELQRRGLPFLDSRTTADSLAEKIAREHGLSATRRDVFLDNTLEPEDIRAALVHLETLARTTGSAVAIGHPKAVTLAALAAWLPTLEEKGFDIVPLAEVIDLRNGICSASADMLPKLLGYSSSAAFGE
jgi:uncharacterized protein